MAVDHKAACAGCHRAEVYGCPGAAAEHHIAATSIDAKLRVGVATGRSNDQIGQAVAVHVARAPHGIAAHVSCALAVDHEAAGARSDRAEVDGCTGAAAQHHIAATGIGAGGRVAEGRSDDQVGQAVAVDISRARHPEAALVTRALAVDHEAACAGCHCAEV